MDVRVDGERELRSSRVRAQRQPDGGRRDTEMQTDRLEREGVIRVVRGEPGQGVPLDRLAKVAAPLLRPADRHRTESAIVERAPDDRHEQARHRITVLGMDLDDPHTAQGSTRPRSVKGLL